MKTLPIKADKQSWSNYFAENGDYFVKNLAQILDESVISKDAKPIDRTITHEDFKEMKTELMLTNAKIAGIVGLTPDSVKNMTSPAKELPAWAKGMTYIYLTLKK